MTTKRRTIKKSHIEAEAESWAVSYADLLMVLMSFFIIFFSLEDSSKSQIIFQIKNDLKGSGGVIEANANGTGLDQDENAKRALAGAGNQKEGSKKATGNSFLPLLNKKKRIPASQGYGHNSRDLGSEDGAAKTAKGLGQIDIGDNEGNAAGLIKLTTIEPSKTEASGSDRWNALLKGGKGKNVYKGGVLIDLSDNIYKNGAYKISDNIQSQIDQVLKSLKPYKDNISVVFIGHADSAPIKKTGQVIEDNLILSALRASKAVEYAVSKGFDPFWVSAQGMSEFNRNTRSLSIRVMQR